MIREEFEVVVVGAGPGRSGERRDARFVRSRDARRRADGRRARRCRARPWRARRTMELLRRWGLEEKAWERSIDVEWQAWACATLADADHGEAVEVGLPTREQALLVSPTSPACLAAGRAGAAARGAPRLLRERACSSAASSSSRSSARSRRRPRAHARRPRRAPPHPRPVRDRRRRRAQPGAGGARHRVRGRRELAERLAVAVPRARSGKLVRDHRYGIYFLDDGRSFLPAGKPDRWVFAMDWDSRGRRALRR